VRSGSAEDVETLSKSVSDQQEQLKAVIDQITVLSAKGFFGFAAA
jgi:hypothetical protein